MSRLINLIRRIDISKPETIDHVMAAIANGANVNVRGHGIIPHCTSFVLRLLALKL